MQNKNFINFHILISHSPSCINRDDMNMQKTATFGGVNRVRISSQSLKRAMRTSEYYRQVFGNTSFRTRKLELAKKELLKLLGDEFEQKVIDNAAERFVLSASSEEAEEDEVSDSEETSETEEGGEKEKNKKIAVAPWIIEEMRVLCRIIKKVTEEGLTDDEKKKALSQLGKTIGKGKDKKKKTEADCINEVLSKKIQKEITIQLETIKSAIGNAVDVALSGRMATSGLMTSIDGSLAVAHAITTHAVEPQDNDWFTAVDDLTEKTGEKGSGHLDTQQFSSGVFYRYASLNLKQLQVNLGLISNMKSDETVESRGKALEVASHVLHMLTTVVPSAKRNSFGQDNMADFALVSFADQPISLVNAFESPIKEKNRGYLIPSIEFLSSYWKKINEFYSLSENASIATIKDAETNGLKKQNNIKELKNWIIKDGN